MGMSRHQSSFRYLAVLGTLLTAAAALLAWPAYARGSEAKLVLTLQNAVKLEHALRVPQELQWARERTVSVHPDGQRVAVLLPLPNPPQLRERPEHGQGDRVYLLEWISLESGEVERSREFLYFRRSFPDSSPLPPPPDQLGPGNVPDEEKFGFALAAGGTHLCTIAGGKILVLDDDLEVVAQRPSVFSDSQGKQWRAGTCSFFPHTTRLLIALWEEGTHPYYATSKLLVYDWREEASVSIAHVEGHVFDAVALAGQRALLVNLVAGFAWRYRIAEVSLNEQSPALIWESLFRENGRQRLVVTRDYVFRGESPWVVPSDHTLWGKPLQDLADWHDLPPLTPLPSPSVVGRIRFWARPSGRPQPEILLNGYDLLWPIAVSSDERWLAARAVHFNEKVGNVHLWDDNRFAVFSIENPKKPVYVSENFGHDEAVTGLAFTPDNSRLVVMTTARLLIYDIKEAPAAK